MTTLCDARFTPSTFGGGWLKPVTDLGRQLAWEALGEKAAQIWPNGFIVEPWQIDQVASWRDELGATIAP